MEYAKDMSDLISEAGLNGTVSAIQTSQNGMEVTADGVRLIFRAPLNRTQDVVSTSWQFIGDWPCATDSVSGRVDGIPERLGVSRTIGEKNTIGLLVEHLLRGRGARQNRHTITSLE